VTNSNVGKASDPVASKWARRLLTIALAYLPIMVLGGVLSIVFDVGAHPGGGPGDMVFKGTALVPPLFLPIVLVGAAFLARQHGAAGVLGKVVAGLIGLAFTAGSTFNLPNDVEAARAAGSPLLLTIASGALGLVLGLTLVVHSALSLRDQAQQRGRS
jgi:hypothetical protein